MIPDKYFSAVACVVVIASYSCSFLLVDLLTKDIRRFMLPVLQCAFVLLVLSACLLTRLSVKRKPSVSQTKIRHLFGHSFFSTEALREFPQSSAVSRGKLRRSVPLVFNRLQRLLRLLVHITLSRLEMVKHHDCGGGIAHKE